MSITKRWLIFLVLLVCAVAFILPAVAENLQLENYVEQNLNMAQDLSMLQFASSDLPAIPNDQMFIASYKSIKLLVVACSFAGSEQVIFPMIMLTKEIKSGESMQVSPLTDDTQTIMLPITVVSGYEAYVTDTSSYAKKPLVALDSASVPDGTDLYTIDISDGSTVKMAGSDIRLLDKDKSDSIMFIYSGSNKWKMSYTPVFTKSNEIVGILYGYLDEAETKVAIIAMDDFHETLSSSASGSGSAITGGSDATAAPTDAAPTATPSTGGTSNGSSSVPVAQLSDEPVTTNVFQENWWLFAILFVEIVTLIVLTLLLVQKKKGGPSGANAKYTLRCYGPLAGKSVSLGKGIVLVGRDPSCGICYPTGTQGISRVHCAISIQNGRVMVTDRGSAYGTFMAGGVRLQSNESRELTRGSSIYLGSPNQNTITLE